MKRNRFRIFDFIRGRQRRWSSGMIVLLLGGWYSGLCLNCLAGENNINAGHSISLSGQHCPPVTEKQGGNHQGNNFHQACDCDTAVAAPLKHSSVTKAIVTQLSTYHYAVNNERPGLLLVYASDISVPFYQRPERSYFLPHDRFSVLLN